MDNNELPTVNYLFKFRKSYTFPVHPHGLGLTKKEEPFTNTHFTGICSEGKNQLFDLFSQPLAESRGGRCAYLCI